MHSLARLPIQNRKILLRIFCISIYLVLQLGLHSKEMLQAQVKIVRVEYYVDTDPGLNNGTPISFTPGAQLSSLTININPALLSNGVHRICIRAKDSLGKWSLNNSLLFIKPYPTIAATPASGIKYAEWFLDLDPGRGSATSIPITSSGPINGVVVNVDPTSLAGGVHQFNIRARDSLGNWSLNQRLLFIKPYSASGSGQLPKITYAEWFTDADPGLGNATVIPISASNDISGAIVSINPATLAGGVHQFTIRAKDSLGKWSLNQRLLFVKPFSTGAGNTAALKVSYAEWFVDTDPGFGNATSIPITASNDINNAIVSINPATLGNGVHQFNIRARDSAGKWSLAQRLLFIKPFSTNTNAPVASKIVYAEWYMDTDPGRGGATPVALTPGTDINGTVVGINPATLSEGVHQFHIRSKDSVGNWSLNQRLLFYKPFRTAADTAIPNLAYIEYYLDTDPGRGNGHAVSFSPGNNMSNLLVSVNKTGLTLGIHKLFLRARDSVGKWSLVNTASFTLISPAITVDTFPAVLCAGANVAIPFTLNGSFNSGNVFTAQLSNAVGSFANAINIGTVAKTTSGSISAVFPATLPAGTGYRVRILSSQPADTSAPNSFPVTIRRIPEQNFSISGPIYTCTDSQTYLFNPVQSGVTYTWRLGPDSIIAISYRVGWNAAGQFSLTLTASNTCGNGFVDTLEVRVFDTVPLLTPSIVKSGNVLSTSRQTVANNMLGQQWYRDSVLIQGATDTFYQASLNGNYNVRYTNSCGGGPWSSTLSFVTLVAQTINFQTIPNKTFGDSAFLLLATASSSLPVSFTILSGPAQITGSTVTITGAGTVTVRASQAGDSQYLAAAPVIRTFTVARAIQSIAFSPIGPKAYGDAPFTVSANSSTGLPVTYSVFSGLASVSGTTVSLTGGGNAIIMGYQPGNQNYLPASVYDTFCIGARQPDTIRGYTTNCIGTQRYYVDSLVGFNYAWSLSGGGTLSPATGGATLVSWSATGTPTLIVSATTTCNSTVQAKSLAVQVVNPQSPGNLSNLFPVDSATVSSLPASFSWAPATNTLLYDMYIWAEGSPIPSTPVFANFSQIGKSVYANNLPGFTSGKRYFWKVVAKNACNQTSSTVQTFKISDLPDLIVSAIASPDTTFSGQNISVNLTVKNTGRARTLTSWYDALYLSADTILNIGVDYPLGNTLYLTALDTQQSYTKNLNVVLPPQMVGNNYILAVTNSGNYVPEISYGNNGLNKNIYIKLTPPPDLRVTSVVTSGNTFSGQSISVTWQVKNQGAGNTTTGTWRDYIYISPDTSFNASASIKLGENTYSQGILFHDSTYSRSKTVVLPDQIFGKYYVYVVTDAINNVFESTFENNNSGKSDSLNIYLTPPPDFIIDNIHAPASASRGETIMVDWTVRNQGAMRQAKDSVWTDIVRVSKDSVIGTSNFFSSVTAIPPLVLNPLCSQYALGVNGCRYAAPVMDAEDVYYTSANVTLPANADSVYVHVKTDDPNRLFEHLNEGNNTAKVKVRFINPDLVVTNLQAPATGASGSTISLSWSIRNNGPGKVINLSRADYVYLSPTQTFNASTAIRIAAFSYNNSVDSGNSFGLQKSVQIPDSVFGSWYVFVKTDAADSIYEANNNNNLSVGAGIQITMPPPPDLHVTQLAVMPNSFTAEHYVGISYAIKNQGLGPISGKSWKDKVYLSRLPAWNVDSAVLLKTVSTTITLYPDSSYALNDSIFINTLVLQKLKIDSANCYFYVWTDAENAVFEYTNENNNIARSGAILARQKVRPDLTVIAAATPDSLRSGTTSNISWTVKNMGGLTSYFIGQWYDGLYLSLDTVLSGSDIFVRREYIQGPLDSGFQYSRSMNFTVPNGLSGYYHLLLVADELNYCNDRNRANNYLIIRDQNGLPHPSYISLTPPADLVIDSFVAPATGYSGQPLSVKWRIKNQGVGATNSNSWIERFYLSTDTILDGSDLPVTSYNRSGALAVNGAYRDSMQVFIPISAQGNYYLLLKTDNNDVVYEHTNENNNVAFSLIFVVLPLPSDLVVRDIVVDSAGLAGDSVSVKWVIKNEGVNPATGFMRQGIYLSTDTVWSNNDILLKDPPYQIALLPGDTANYVTKFRVKDVSPGDYYAIVRTDLLNNIYEQDETNNTSFSSRKISVGIMRLPIDTTRYNVLNNNYELYYRIDIPDSLEGETLSVTLKGDSLKGANELYLRHETIPTRATYDFVYDRALSANQQIIIPELKKGTYYLLAYGATTAATQQQQISLLAQKINFSIISVLANQGGNTGNVTIKLTGAKFQPGMKARLYESSLGVITASSIYYVNPNLVYATFNLAGKQKGTYHVKLVKQGIDSISALNAFTIVAGSGGVAGGGAGSGSGSGFYCSVVNTGAENLLGIDVLHPSSTLVNRTFPMTIVFGNSGDVDIPVPTRRLVSTARYPVAFSSARLVDKKDELYMEFKEVNGPPNLLRPGATGYVTIFTTSNGWAVMTFKLVE
jgi:hypothetical protein